MESTAFDQLARAWGHAPSRRSLLRGVAVVALGAIARPGRAAQAALICPNDGQPCASAFQCCSLACTAPAEGLGVCCTLDRQVCDPITSVCCRPGAVCARNPAVCVSPDVPCCQG